MSHPPWSNRKACTQCGRDMSANDAHRICQPCRPYTYLAPSREREHYAEWQRRDRAKNGRRENRA